MLRKLTVVSIMFLLFLDCEKIFAEEGNSVIESFGKGEINWTTGVIRAKGVGLAPSSRKAKGEGRLFAQRAAKIDAYRNILEIVNGVRVNSDTTVENFVLKNSRINTQVKGFIKGARETDIKYYADESVEVTIEAPINGKGGLADIILPALSEPRIVEVNEPLVKQEEKTEEIVQENNEIAATEKKEEVPAVYTGLVIDAKGLGVQPSLSPKILTEEKEEVYGIRVANPQCRTEIGLVEYNSDIDKVKENQRVTQVPYIIKGISADKSNIIIKTSQAHQLQMTKESKDIFDKCRVIIVLE